MDYIWEPIIQFLQNEIDLEELSYIVQKNQTSPYLELQSDSLFEEKWINGVVNAVDVNPYVRFSEIFTSFLTADDLGYNEFNAAFSDILLHFLASIDLKMGMCKREFYIKFIIADMQACLNKEEWDVFNIVEKRVVADGILNLYETSDYMMNLLDVTQKIIPYCLVSVRDRKEIIFYMREPRKSKSERKIMALIHLFLPISYHYVIHWTKTYGTVGYDESMILGDFIL